MWLLFGIDLGVGAITMNWDLFLDICGWKLGWWPNSRVVDV